MTKRKIITTITCILLVYMNAFAQKGTDDSQRQRSKEKIKALKIAHITTKLELTPDEAQKFWPVYNEFETKKDVLHKEKKELRKAKKSMEEPTDSEIEKNIEAHFNLKEKELALERAYHSKFKAVLPISKVDQLYKAQYQFKKDLLKKMKVKKGGPNELNIPPPSKK